MNTCRDCKNFIGCGDWNLCCRIKPDLVYEDSEVCDKFAPHNGRTNPKLKQCTCGGTPLIVRDWNCRWDDAHVFCPKCGVTTMTYTRRYNAMKAWNEGRIYYPDDLVKK